MGRRPIGKTAMSGAERQAAYMERRLKRAAGSSVSDEKAGAKDSVSDEKSAPRGPSARGADRAAEFEQRVMAEVRRRIDELVLPAWRQKIATAERVVAFHKELMPRALFL
jgi:hypothetical protein